MDDRIMMILSTSILYTAMSQDLLLLLFVFYLHRFDVAAWSFSGRNLLVSRIITSPYDMNNTKR